MQKNSFNLFFFFVLITFSKLSAQDAPSLEVTNQYPWIKQEKNEIINRATLAPFFEKLYQLKQTKKGQINIVHIGDSHIQADFLTQTVRTLLQKEFGNAGRGFVFPGRVAHTNEPISIYSSSAFNWEAKRIVFTNQSLPIGLGASTIRTVQPNAKFSIVIKDDAMLNYGFNTVAVFYQKDVSSFNVILKDSSDRSLAFVGSFTTEGFPNYSKVTLPYSLHKLEFQVDQPTLYQNQFTLFGLMVSNGNPGVLYHAIGGNGAKFKHYLAAQFFAEQVQALSPDLLIVSLGTNEAIENPVDIQFSKQAEDFINTLQKNNPQAQIILTTPVDFYRKKIKRNPGVEVVQQQLLQLAETKKTACWDLYSAGGGKNAADQWRKYKLLQSDGVHSTASGYTLQGTMLYQALVKGYTEYVHGRYP